MSASGLHVAVAGATGVVGREMVRVLEQRRFPVDRLRLLASSRSAGRRVEALGREVEVEDLETADLAGVDLVLLSAGSGPSRTHAPRAAAAGALVVDNSSAWRLDPAVPLVVPEVNGALVVGLRQGIVANPNCSTILLVVVLAPIERHRRVRRVVVATYQAVSGSGAAGLEELARQAGAEAAGGAAEPRAYPKPIHRNVLPFVQAFAEDGLTTEEWKMVRETRRILGREDLGVTATCVRVPVLRAHSEAVNVELEAPATPDEVRSWLRAAPGVQVVDDPARRLFPTPRDAEDGDDVLVGRVRRDPSCPRAVDLWLVGDQVRKGAALNAVQIAEVAFGIAPPGGGMVTAPGADRDSLTAPKPRP